MKQIDLNEWEQSGESTFGVSYFHKTDNSLMLKVLRPGYPEDDFISEYRMSKAVCSLGVPSPAPGEMVLCNGQKGIMFQRIFGKRSYCKAIGDNPDDIPWLAKNYADETKKLHSIICDPSVFTDVKELYRKKISDNPYRDKHLISKALDMMGSLPDSDTCLHGDMHFGNMIIAGEKSYFIDLGNFCHGHYLFDFAMPELLIRFGQFDPERFMNNYHCRVEDAEAFWNLVLKEYFGQDISIEEKKHELLPYIALRQLTVETEANMLIPDELTRPLYEQFS